MSESPILIPLPEQLAGERVVVRSYREGDAQGLWEAVDESRDHLRPWLPWVDGYRSVDDAAVSVARFQAKWLVREDLVVGVFDRESGTQLGGSGLHRIDWEARAFEIGYWLRRSAEGHGYMAEAVQLLTILAFDRLEANRVEIRMDTRNVRSRNVPERLGFVREGTLRDNALGADGSVRSTDIYALTAGDYQGLEWPLKGRQHPEGRAERAAQNRL